MVPHVQGLGEGVIPANLPAPAGVLSGIEKLSGKMLRSLRSASLLDTADPLPQKPSVEDAQERIYHRRSQMGTCLFAHDVHCFFS